MVLTLTVSWMDLGLSSRLPTICCCVLLFRPEVFRFFRRLWSREKNELPIGNLREQQIIHHVKLGMDANTSNRVFHERCYVMDYIILQNRNLQHTGCITKI